MSDTSARGRMPSSTAVFLQLIGLGALAFAQPLLQLIKENPEFLVVHHSGPLDVLVLVGALFLLAPVAVTVLVALVAAASRKAGLYLQALVLGILFFLTMLPVLEKLPFLAGWATLAVSALAGGALAAGYLKSGLVYRNLSLLSLGAPVFLILFLGSGAIRGFLFPGGIEAVDQAASQPAAGPVVMIIFDEFPVASLMDENHQIDCDLFPNFCRLAEAATWYPRATTISPATLRSVPAIMTGKFPGWKQKPDLESHPENIFTLLSSSHQVHSYEALTDICPENLKQENRFGLAQRLPYLLQDLGIIYQHLVVPQKWRGKLVPIADKWGFFLDTATSPGKLNRLEQLDDFVAGWTAGPDPLLAVAHVLLPHTPCNYLPDGRVYNRRGRAPDEPDGTWGPDTIMMAHSYRCHLLQVCAVDRFVGRLLDRLQELGIFEETTLVLTADHGLAFRTGLHRRRLNEGNEADIMSVPLFIKLPGQTAGRVDEQLAQTVDVMPTLAAALGADTGWEFDGRDLNDGRPGRAVLDFLDQDRYEERKIEPEMMNRKDEAIALKRRLFGDEGGYERLFTMSDPGGLLGRSLDELEVRQHPTLTGRIIETVDLQDVDLEGRYLPAEINGTLDGHEGPGRLTLGLALNGKLAGFTETYLAAPGPGQLAWQVTATPAAFRDGANEAQLFLVENTASGVALARIPMTALSFLGRNLGGKPVAGVREDGLFGPHDWKGVWARWTDGSARWVLPLKADERPGELTLGLASSGPAGADLEVTVNGVRLLKQHLPQGKWETRLPLDRVPAADRLTIEIDSRVFVPAEVNPGSTDRRKLGVAVSTLVVK
jgi:hypothetical protein